MAAARQIAKAASNQGLSRFRPAANAVNRSGKAGITKEQVDLRVVANRAAESVRPFMDARKHDFSVALPIKAIWVEAVI